MGNIVDTAAVREKYRALTLELIDRGLTITTMESCTGGQLASLITDTEGASEILQGALVTYSNEAKALMGVNPRTIETFGVYSSETAREMAEACRRTFSADIGIGVTGSFGNADPNNLDSVPGQVYYAISTHSGTRTGQCLVPPQPTRLHYKLYVAGVVCDALRGMEEVSDMCNLGYAVESVGVAKGLKKGMEKGMEKGIAKGAEMTLLSSIKNLMETMKWTAAEAMDALKIPASEQNKYAEQL